MLWGKEDENMGNCVLLLIHDIYYSYRNIIIKMNKEDIYKHQDSHSTLPIYSNKNVERKIWIQMIKKIWIMSFINSE